MSTTLINLLPDVRQAKVRDRARRRTTSLILSITLIAGVGFVLILVLITQGQGFRIRSLTSDIVNKQNQLQNDSDLAKALTTQKKLTLLNALYSQRFFTSNFLTLLGQIMPNGAAVSSVTITTDGKITATVSAKDLATSDKLVKALNASNVTLGKNANNSNNPDFGPITIASFTADDKNVITFTINSTINNGVYGHGRQ